MLSFCPKFPFFTGLLSSISLDICAEDDNDFSYWTAELYKGGEVPAGLKLFTFPESDWTIFSAKGTIPQSLQTLNTQVWNEWAPNVKTMYEIGSSFLEIYSAMH